MVKQIKCYEDSSGKLHKAAFDAYRADLAIFFARSEAVSETSAKQLADRISGSDEELSELIETLKAVRANSPTPPAIAATYGDDHEQ